MRNPASIVTKLLRSRDFWVRIAFLGLAAGLWLLIKLSKTGYVHAITQNVAYINVPANKVLMPNSQSTLNLRIRSQGYKLLRPNAASSETIEIDVKRVARRLNKKGDRYYWLPNLHREELISELRAGTTLLRIEPDTVFIELAERVTKQLPVKLHMFAQFEKGFEAYDKPLLIPHRVRISGPKQILDTLTFVATEPLNLSGVFDDIREEVAILLPSELLEANPPTVVVQQGVDRFTEKKMVLPVEVINMPEGEKVNIFPNKIEVVFSIAYRDYALLTAENVQVVCDLSQLRKHPNRQRLHIDVHCTLRQAVVLRQSHQTVDYLRFK